MMKINFLQGKSALLKKIILYTVVLLILVVAGYLTYNYYLTQRELSEYLQDTDVLAIKDKNELLKKLQEIALLPQDEEPTIATVNDAFRLRGQKFFAQAENGDKVVIYKKAQRAILYRPSTGMIVESAPVNIKDLEGSVANDIPESTSSSYRLDEKAQDQVQEPARLAIYNGTLYIEGLAAKVGAYLVKEIPGDKISVDILKNTENADEPFEETVVIEITDGFKEISENIASLLEGTVQKSEENVNYPDVDIIIIAGLDLADKNLD